MQYKHWLAAIAVVVTGFGSVVSAQEYPQRPVLIVVAVPAGGSIDMVARIMAQELGARYKQTFLVENKTGGAGIIGTNEVAQAKPDGYTLGIIPDAFVATNVSLFSNLPYDPLKDLKPISKLVDQTLVLTVPAGSPYKTVDDLIAAARAKKGELTFGSGGEGSPHHLSGLLFASKTGVELLHVPYKGGAPAQTDLLGGHLDMVFAPLPEVLANIRAGKLRGLAILGPERLSLLPDIPTLPELGIEGVQLSAWMGLFAPAGTPDEIIQSLNKQVTDILAGPVKDKLAETGLEASASTPQELEQLLRDDIKLHGELIKSAGIKIQ